MRYILFGLVLCMACTRVSTSSQRVPRAVAPTCALLSSSQPIAFTSDDTRQAMRDFTQQTGAPYTALYIRKVPGRGEQASSCIRVVQSAATRFTCYTYRGQRVTQVRRGRATWAVPFAQLQPGHYSSLCQQYGMDTAYWVVLVKRNTAVTFSLSLEDGQYEHLAEADQRRIAPAINLLQVLMQ
jgi:hypothetical protein